MNFSELAKQSKSKLTVGHRITIQTLYLHHVDILFKVTKNVQTWPTGRYHTYSVALNVILWQSHVTLSIS